MKMNKFDLNLLLTFHTIYQERNLTKASEVLNLSQPAVSHALTRLRHLLGDNLFVRQKGGVVPTPYSESIAPDVATIISILENSFYKVEKFTPESSRRVFRISMHDLTDTYIFPRLITYTRKHAPNIKIENVYVPREEVAHELSKGSLDLAINIPLPEDKRYTSEHLYNDTYVCLLNDHHPSVDGSLSQEEYLSLKHVNVDSRNHHTNYLEHSFISHGLHRDIIVRTHHFSNAIQIAKEADLALTLPKRLAQKNSLTTAELDFSVPDLRWFIYTSKQYYEDHSITWLKKKIFECIS